jgi:hypothetical protein
MFTYVPVCESQRGVGMTEEDRLRDKLLKIEALFARAGTHGERMAAESALNRIRARLAEAFPPKASQAKQAPPKEPQPKQPPRETSVVMRFSLPDPWSRRLFVALCRRHGLKPYREPRQRKTTVMLLVVRSFVDHVLWPEFETLNRDLVRELSDTTNQVILRSGLHGRKSRAA